jgi:pilus assembly protein CpaC
MPRLSNRLSHFFAVGVFLAAVALGVVASPAEAIEVVGPDDTRLFLELNKGSLIRLDRDASSVFVADPDIADIQVKSPRLIYVVGLTAGETSLFALDSRERVLANVNIRVEHSLRLLEEALATLVPEEQVRLGVVDSTLIVDGTVSNSVVAADIEQIVSRFAGDAGFINRLKVDSPNQVNLRVRVAEVSRSVIKDLGVNWEGAFSIGGLVLGLATGNPLLAAGQFLTRQGNTNSAFGGGQSGNLDLNVLVDALADEGLITVLAEPNLTALSGETASFLAGGEFPIPIPQGNDTVAIEFKQFGVHLDFTPVVLSNGAISLRVRPEVSQLSATGAVTINNFVIPALTTRRAETTVELGSGQSFAIAGLLQNTVNHDISEVPGLGDIPTLGAMFRSDNFQRDESELVIIITPYLVRPVTGDQLASPSDGLVAPNDVERILEGRTYGAATGAASASVDGPRLIGPSGFIVE